MFVFFVQKTAYELRISDWSSDVCSSDLLELSGIGRPDVLQTAGLPVRHALPGVGANYIDHYATRMNWRVRGMATLNETTRGLSLGAAVLQYLLRRKGILTLGTGLVFGFVKTRHELAAPAGKCSFVLASFSDAARLEVSRVGKEWV